MFISLLLYWILGRILILTDMPYFSFLLIYIMSQWTCFLYIISRLKPPPAVFFPFLARVFVIFSLCMFEKIFIVSSRVCIYHHFLFLQVLKGMLQSYDITAQQRKRIISMFSTHPCLGLLNIAVSNLDIFFMTSALISWQLYTIWLLIENMIDILCDIIFFCLCTMIVLSQILHNGHDDTLRLDLIFYPCSIKLLRTGSDANCDDYGLGISLLMNHRTWCVISQVK